VGAPAMLINLSPDTARLAANLGDDDLLHTVTANLARIAGNTVSPMAHAYSDWVSAWLTGDYTSAARAAGSAHTCGRHAEFARASHDTAVLAARVGAVDDARRFANVAFVAYDSLRAQHLHARLRAELRASGVSMRPRRTPQRPTSGWEAFTPTERQVVELVGDGMANGQIAEQLFVSRRTVESHLVRVYQKLGFARRSELVIAERQRREELAASMY
jgi:DNA-binding CsgD family transcriptional regulator